MNEQYLDRAIISPVPDGEKRLLWSVMIPTYNCANYLRETLTSVLSQDPGPEIMQIEVVDDHSTKDDPEAVVRELAGDRVSFYRQPENGGYINNFNTCLKRSRGKLIHLLHGDDCVRDDFYGKMQHLFEQHVDIGAAFCRHIYIDRHGHWQTISPLEETESRILNNWLERIASGQKIVPSSIVVRRDVYEKLGGFDSRFTHTGEDWEMWVRIATKFSVGYEVEPLALYRHFTSGSLTQTSVVSGKFFEDVRKAKRIIHRYLPEYLKPEIVNQVSNKSRDISASSAINQAYLIFINTGNIKALSILILEALKFGYSPTTILRIFNMIFKIARYKLNAKASF